MAQIVKSKIDSKPPVSENIVSLILSGIKKHKDKTLIVDYETGRKWTGLSLSYTISSVCHQLIEVNGLKPGDRCLIYGHNNDIAAILITAILACGGVVTMTHTTYPGANLADFLQVAGTKFLLISESLKRHTESHLKSFGESLKIILYDHDEGSKCQSLKKLLLSKQQSVDFEKFDEICEITSNAKPNDFAVIQFSSGTTGKPKPIPRTYANLCHLIAVPNHSELLNFDSPNFVVAGATPLGFRPGIWLYFSCLVYGGTIVFWASPNWCPESLLCCIEKYKVTTINLSLPVLSGLGSLDKAIIKKYDLSSLKEIITSGAKLLNISLAKEIVKNLELDTLRQSFGMTESGLVFLIEKSLAKDNYLSVGHPTPGTLVKIVDKDSGKVLKANEKGEIMIKSKQLFPGYLVPGTSDLNRTDFDKEGFFRIGDFGYFDENDLFYIEGRYKEMMISSGNLRFSPTNVEMLLINHESVLDACVVKANTNTNADFAYDVPVAFVILKHGLKTNEEELKDYVAKNSVCKLDRVVFMEHFVRLPNGKIDKKALLNMLSN